MADALEIMQSNYGRLEKDDKRLTLPKIQKIADVLNVTIALIFNEQSSKVIRQTQNESPASYNVENLYQDNKEVYEKLENALYQQIVQLKEEIIFLREKI